MQHGIKSILQEERMDIELATKKGLTKATSTPERGRKAHKTAVPVIIENDKPTPKVPQQYDYTPVWNMKVGESFLVSFKNVERLESIAAHICWIGRKIGAKFKRKRLVNHRARFWRVE